MILNTIIKHWVFDIGLSKLYDNVINNFHITTDNNRMQKIDEALLEALDGYPYTTVRLEDRDIVINIAILYLLKQNIDPTEDDRLHIRELLETMQLC